MARSFFFVAFVLIAGCVSVLLTGCATTGGNTTPYVGALQHGLASWYGSEQGHYTASGERFNPNALTAAHRHLPFGSVVRVTNELNGRSVDVRINDRGPYAGNERIIDVTSAAADVLQMKRTGTVPIELEVLSVGTEKYHRSW
jgi:rare lipoprotein A